MKNLRKCMIGLLVLSSGFSVFGSELGNHRFHYSVEKGQGKVINLKDNYSGVRLEYNYRPVDAFNFKVELDAAGGKLDVNGTKYNTANAHLNLKFGRNFTLSDMVNITPYGGLAGHAHNFDDRTNSEIGYSGLIAGAMVEYSPITNLRVGLDANIERIYGGEVKSNNVSADLEGTTNYNISPTVAYNFTENFGMKLAYDYMKRDLKAENAAKTNFDDSRFRVGLEHTF